MRPRQFLLDRIKEGFLLNSSAQSKQTIQGFSTTKCNIKNTNLINNTFTFLVFLPHKTLSQRNLCQNLSSTFICILKIILKTKCLLLSTTATTYYLPPASTTLLILVPTTYYYCYLLFPIVSYYCSLLESPFSAPGCLPKSATTAAFFKLS